MVNGIAIIIRVRTHKIAMYVMMIAVSQVFGRFDRCEIDGPVETERFRLFFFMVATGHQHCRQLQLLQVVTYTVPQYRLPILLHRRRSAVVGTRRSQHANKFLYARQSTNVYNFFFCRFEFSRGISYIQTPDTDVTHMQFVIAYTDSQVPMCNN